MEAIKSNEIFREKKIRLHLFICKKVELHFLRYSDLKHKVIKQ